MGYEEIPGMKSIIFKDMSAGWFPGKEHNDIPGDMKRPEQPVGMLDGNAVVWLDGALRTFWGYDNANTSALNSGAVVTSLFASDVIDQFISTCGDKIYSGADQAAPTDITSSLTITPDIQWSWSEWQFETDAYIIGTNGTDAPIKWDGTGNAELLGGTPPVGNYLEVWQNAVWMAGTSSEPSTLYFSDLADPEVWTTNNDYKFNAPITGIGTLGDLLVVFKDDGIGVLSGQNNQILTKVDNFIRGRGCSGGHSIVNAKLNHRDVLVFHSYDGWYAFDGSQDLIYLSHPLANKYRVQSNVTQFNQARFSNVWAEYLPQYEWVVAGMSDSGDSTNDFMIILDMNRFYGERNRGFVPHWPVDGIPANCLVRSKRITSQANELYMGDNSGFIHKFDPEIFNNNGSVYNKYFQSKIFDNIQTWIMVELNLLADEANTTMTTYINADLETGDGTSGSASFLDSADLLGSTFILGTSVLGGKDFKFVDAATDAFGRFLQFKLQNNVVDKSFALEEVNLVIQEIGLDPNATQE